MAPTLTVVLIAYNAGPAIDPTLEHLATAVTGASWPGVDVVVVDDGSTDDTAARVRAFADTCASPICLVQQDNQGRLAARRTGLDTATGDFILFLDVRVHLHPDSLAYLREQLETHPERRVWNCHIEVPAEGNLQAQFWNSLNFVGWRRYLADPRLVSFGLDEFDYYPTGTGGFVGPRELIAAGFGEMDSIFDAADARCASDDTALLRYIAATERIWMAPGYSASYLARSGVADFVHHTFDRGTMFLDSYLRPGTRLYWPTIGVLAASVPAAVLALAKPKLLLGVPAAVGAATAGLAALGVDKRNLPGFAALAPVFGVVFTAGMWKGMGLLARARSRQP